MRGISTRRFLFVAVSGTAALLTACGGSPTVKVVTASPTTSAPSSSSAAPSSSAAETSATPTATAENVSQTSGCPATAAYCDDFTDKNSGWTDNNATNYYQTYDSYMGGTYRMGERTDHTATADAPFDINKVSTTSSVQIDVDAVLGDSAPTSSELGIICWDQPTKDNSTTSSFAFFVGQQTASILLWDQYDGSKHDIVSKDVSTGLQPRKVNHLTAQCVQSDAGAQLQLAVNGQPVISTTYGRGTNNYAWSVANKVGLLVAGTGSDVFYKNFAVSPVSGSSSQSSSSSGGSIAVPISDSVNAVTALVAQAKTGMDHGQPTAWPNNAGLALNGSAIAATPTGISGFQAVLSKSKNTQYLAFAVMDTGGHCSGAVLEVNDAGTAVTKAIPVLTVSGKCTGSSLAEAMGYL